MTVLGAAEARGRQVHMCLSAAPIPVHGRLSGARATGCARSAMQTCSRPSRNASAVAPPKAARRRCRATTTPTIVGGESASGVRASARGGTTAKVGSSTVNRTVMRRTGTIIRSDMSASTRRRSERRSMRHERIRIGHGRGAMRAVVAALALCRAIVGDQDGIAMTTSAAMTAARVGDMRAIRAGAEALRGAEVGTAAKTVRCAEMRGVQAGTGAEREAAPGIGAERGRGVGTIDSRGAIEAATGTDEL
mmetsp:Transcript_22897/g.70116  ORF Transcript_22897/g.70116 Transcript_22897/m.70116 type:complete len:249 (-) Transcript_22897:574-1320(-)